MGISTNDFEGRKYNSRLFKVYWNFFHLFLIVKLDAAVGFGGFGKVLKVINIKTRNKSIEGYNNNR
jgi:hypothetical protein